MSDSLDGVLCDLFVARCDGERVSTSGGRLISSDNDDSYNDGDVQLDDTPNERRDVVARPQSTSRTTNLKHHKNVLVSAASGPCRLSSVLICFSIVVVVVVPVSSSSSGTLSLQFMSAQ